MIGNNGNISVARVLIDFDNNQAVVVRKNGEDITLEEYIKREVRKALREVSE